MFLFFVLGVVFGGVLGAILLREMCVSCVLHGLPHFQYEFAHVLATFRHPACFVTPSTIFRFQFDVVKYGWKGVVSPEV